MPAAGRPPAGPKSPQSPLSRTPRRGNDSDRVGISRLARPERVGQGKANRVALRAILASFLHAAEYAHSAGPGHANDEAHGALGRGLLCGVLSVHCFRQLRQQTRNGSEASETRVGRS
eukprot:scaffold165212_cov39-Prasinocladus_malaysianus.AAC.1